ncbi:hypothetical protein PGH26_09000 [Sporosarcina jeotgali]|uniref:Uncharacterized protein n=1 Tax=Sporosarcina jeotgali TaxID=3020056 RepID=A0ABZ0KTD7_9BACL|nr:hypothetical protein [Sporosarcina sp. B2O-1]WOV83073.1 hypothetical protein PGH26_09000 [Sporosarcina sp. B2O-1]
MTVEDLDAQFIEYERISNQVKELQQQQEDVLAALLEKSKDLIEWYHKKNLIFTHPSIQLHTSRGPILGFNKTDYDLMVYDVKSGILKINLRNKEEVHTTISHIVEEGYFPTAMDGLLYLKSMLGHYLDEVNELNSELESQLSKYG